MKKYIIILISILVSSCSWVYEKGSIDLFIKSKNSEKLEVFLTKHSHRDKYKEILLYAFEESLKYEYQDGLDITFNKLVEFPELEHIKNEVLNIYNNQSISPSLLLNYSLRVDSIKFVEFRKSGLLLIFSGTHSSVELSRYFLSKLIKYVKRNCTLLSVLDIEKSENTKSVCNDIKELIKIKTGELKKEPNKIDVDKIKQSVILELNSLIDQL